MNQRIKPTRSGFQKSHRLALICLIISCIFVSGCNDKLVGSPATEFEANAMLDILDSNGFDVGKQEPQGEEKRWTIVVREGWFGEGEQAAAIKILRDYGLPRSVEPEVKQEDAFGMSSERKEIDRLTRARQTDLERTFYTYPDVISATVILAEPKIKIFDTEKEEPKASVTLMLKQENPQVSADFIKRTVSGGVVGLSADSVEVIIMIKPIRPIQREKMQSKNRQNAVFAIGFGIVILLAGILGAAFYVSRKRKDQDNADYEDSVGELDGEVDSDGTARKLLE